MNVKNSSVNFGLVSRALHMIYMVLFFGLCISMLYEQIIPEGSVSIIEWHSAIGYVALLLIFVRQLWMKYTGKPKALGTQIEKIMAVSSYYALVIIMTAMPLSGAFMVLAKAKDLSIFGMFTIQGFAERSPELIYWSSVTHEYLSYFSYLIIAGHVAGTMFHHFIIKDATVTRMFGKEQLG